jgi:DNA-directed RNA polymerase specialized sigma24 family protein
MEDSVTEAAFEHSYPGISRVAEVRAATIVALHKLPNHARRDLEQEVLLELWRKRLAYDPGRGSWRTFSERVAANRLTSLVRTMHKEPAGDFREERLENLITLAAPNDPTDLRVDVSRVLASVSQFDRSVAVRLIDSSAKETGQRLGVSRATIYRAIARLRVVFAVAGFAGSQGHPYTARRSSCVAQVKLPRPEATA